MLAKFFSFGKRQYVNNAVATADILEYIFNNYGNVRNFKIHFRKPICSQGFLEISFFKLEGHFVGQFEVNNTIMYFAYLPTDVQLEERELTLDSIYKKIDIVNLCYYVAENCHQCILKSFVKHYGPRTDDDKSIFVIYEIPDTSVFFELVRNQRIPVLSISEPEIIGDRKFKLSVLVDNKLLGYRYNTVKKFIL